MISNIEDFFVDGCGRCERFATADCSARRWAGGLAELRRICLGAGLVETVKWGHPCYLHADRNIAVVGALRGDFRLSFFNAALMTDPQGLLEKQGPNTQHKDVLRFVSNSQPAELAPTIHAYLKEAMGYADAGVKAPREVRELELPDELADALDADALLGSAFQALTPGRQRSYVIALSSAKTSATRAARVEKFRERIIQGKGALER